MALILALLVMYLVGAAVVYGVWRGRRSAMLTGGGRWMLRGWHIAMWLAVSMWLTAVAVVAMVGAGPVVLGVVLVLPGGAFFAIGRRLHHR